MEAGLHPLDGQEIGRSRHPAPHRCVVVTAAFVPPRRSACSRPRHPGTRSPGSLARRRPRRPLPADVPRRTRAAPSVGTRGEARRPRARAEAVLRGRPVPRRAPPRPPRSSPAGSIDPGHRGKASGGPAAPRTPSRGPSSPSEHARSGHIGSIHEHFIWIQGVSTWFHESIFSIKPFIIQIQAMFLLMQPEISLKHESLF